MLSKRIDGGVLKEHRRFEFDVEPLGKFSRCGEDREGVEAKLVEVRGGVNRFW